MNKFACHFWLTSASLALGMALTACARANCRSSPRRLRSSARSSRSVPAAQGTAKTGQKTDTKPNASGEDSASTQRLRLGALDPSTPPTDVPHSRKIIGLAMGGGGAVAMSEIGALQWFEEHRIPVDVIAGTSMGSILAALYSTGKTPDQMQHIMTEESVTNVFRVRSEYTSRDFRRREDSREVPNAIGIGPRHGGRVPQCPADRHRPERAARSRVPGLQRSD